jgi:two-component system, chemotaxis family, chemotaxis protein CheY
VPRSHVLLVEDDDHLREATADALRDSGIEVIEASDGRQGLEAMRAAPPCLVLLDLMMPIMDGWELARVMASDPELAAIPICVVSAVPHQAPPQARHVLPKPTTLSALLSVVRAHTP